MDNPISPRSIASPFARSNIGYPTTVLASSKPNIPLTSPIRSVPVASPITNIPVASPIRSVPEISTETNIMNKPGIILEVLGRGTYGKVRKVKFEDGSIVAVKTINLKNGDGVTQTSSREIHALQTLKGCSHILQLLNVKMSISYGDTRVDLMTSYHSSDMTKFISNIPVFEKLKYFASIFEQMMTALNYLYDRGIIHGDIKPDNILMDYVYDKVSNTVTVPPICYLADFGLAQQVACDKSKRGFNTDLHVYSGQYRPPEIFAGNNYNDKADIWAMGVALLEYLAGTQLIRLSLYTDESIIYLMLESLRTPLNKTEENIERLKKSEIHDSIDVPRFLSNHMSAYHFSIIPNDILNFLTQMLAINPTDRIHITQLSTAQPCIRKETMPPRGPIVIQTDINNGMLYILYDWLIDVAKMFKLKIKTLISTLDLIDRYTAKYSINRSQLQLLGITCMLISCNMIEIYSPEITDFVFITDNTYTSQQIKDMEIMVIERMNYILVSCDIEDYVETLKDKKFAIIKEIYNRLNKTHTRIGTLSYPNLIAFAERVLSSEVPS